MEEVTLEKQKVFISCLIGNRELLSLCANIIRSSYFDPSLKKTVSFVLNYFSKYKDIPRAEVIRAETGILIESVNDLSHAETKYISEEIEKFCQVQAVTEAVLKGPELIQKKEFGKLVEIIKDASVVSLHREIGLDYFNDPEERIRSILLERPRVSTGWLEFDDIIAGGIARQELILFAANSGGGKSVVMLNIAKNLLMQGYSGVYITLEMSEDIVSRRLDSMLSHVSQQDIPKQLNKVVDIITKARDKMGRFIIKRMPENRTNINTITAYLKQLEQSSGFRPDFIVVDYIDILGTIQNISYDNLFVKDKYVTEEVRSLGFDFDAMMISASQLGRCLSENSLITLSTGEKTSLKNIAVGDDLLSNNGIVKVLAKTPAMKKPVYRIKLKNGQEVIATTEHKFPTDDGEKSIATGLSVGDKLFVFLSMKSEIESIEYLGEEIVYDIQVSGNNLFYANDILTHNSAIEAEKLTQAHIQGGISKINTSDFTVGIKMDEMMQASGEIYLELLKSRHSPAGKRVLLKWDNVSLCITSKQSKKTELVFNKKQAPLSVAGTVLDKGEPDILNLINM